MSTPAAVEVINDVSGYLAANRVANGDLFSPALDKNLPLKLYMEGKALSWGVRYGAANLQAVANYVLALDGPFGSTARAVISGGGGGSVSPITPPTGTLPQPYDFQVDASSAPLKDGDTTATLSDFIGYNISFSRGGINQNTTNLADGSSFFLWNRATGLFTVSPAVVTGELLRIMPVG